MIRLLCIFMGFNLKRCPMHRESAIVIVFSTIDNAPVICSQVLPGYSAVF